MPEAIILIVGLYAAWELVRVAEWCEKAEGK